MMKENIVKMVLENASRYNSREVFRQRGPEKNSFNIFTWESLVSHSQKVSRSLLALGTETFENIGIFSDNRPEWVFTDLGIMGIRGVVVPFYSTSSKQQLKDIVE